MAQTPLRERHIAAGARFVSFAGWEMPVEYSGIRAEHHAVRSEAGIFDVSHMGQIETTGPEALAFLQRTLSNDVSRMPIGGAQYALLCREDGGVLDDLVTCRLDDERFLTVTNCANHERDLRWLRDHAAGFDVEVHDRADGCAMLALQGPAARDIAGGLTSGTLPARMCCAEVNLAGVSALACGTGYTGEAGLELLVLPEDAGTLWDAALAGGATPVGLGARDTLRLEVCFHLYGNELSESRDPISGGLGWCCKEDTGFIGSEAVSRARAEGPGERLVAFRMSDQGIARCGHVVREGGVVTSGTVSPTLGVAIGMAYVPASHAVPGSEIEIDIRGRRRRARVAERPLYRREEK